MCLLHWLHIQREGEGEHLLAFPCRRINPSKKNVCRSQKKIRLPWTPGETDVDTDGIDMSSDRWIPLPPQTLRTWSIAISTELTVNPGHLCLHKQVVTHGLFFSYWLAYRNIQVVVSRSAWTTPSPRLLPTGASLIHPMPRAGTCSLLPWITLGALGALAASGNLCCWKGVPSERGFAAT